MNSIIENVKTIDHDYEVFISYRHEDPAYDFAKSLYEELRYRYAITAFRDSEELHFGNFEKQLVRYNKKSRCLVLLITENTFEHCKDPDNWIRKEITLFLRRRKPIIPVCIGREFPKKEELPEALYGLLKYADQAQKVSINAISYEVREIAEHIHSVLRKRWSEKDADKAIYEKEYLSRHNREQEDNYFYNAAMKLRTELIVFAAQLILCLLVYDGFLTYDTDKFFRPILFCILSMYLFCFDRGRKKDKRGVVASSAEEEDEVEDSLLNSFLDNSFIDFWDDWASVENKWKWIFWIFLFIVVYFVVLVVNMVVGGFFGDTEACFALNAHFFLICPLVRYGGRLWFSIRHVFNSLYSPYPKIYLRRKSLRKREKAFGVWYWILVGFFVVFLFPYLSLIAGGVL